MRTTKTLLILAGLAGGVLGTSLASPYAVQIVGAQGPFGPSPYNDTNAVLAAPATRFYDPFGGFGGGTTNRRVKLVEAAFNIAANTNGLITPNLITTLDGGSRIIARFDHPVYDNSANPYGIDFLVFGNAFYSASVLVNDSTDMNTAMLTGGPFSERIKVSVSPGYTGQPGESPNDPDTWPWYRYDNGPYGDSAFPTQAFKWNRATTNWTDEVMDFTKPVNPVLKGLFSVGGMSVADAIDLYVGSGGGTGFDLHESGFAWIQYVKVEGIDPDFSDGEIDAFAIVRPMTVGDTLSITPENILSNTSTLLFQKPGVESENQLTLAFNSISGIAQVATATLGDLASRAPLPGTSLNAVLLELSAIPGTNAVSFEADLALSAGQAYTGNGSDLLVLQANGTNWNFCPFTYIATNHQVSVAGVTNLSAFVVAQFTSPMLTLNVAGGSHNIGFTPLAGLVHTLERSTNLVNWTQLNSFTASNSLPVSIVDNTPPIDRAFYRLRLNTP